MVDKYILMLIAHRELGKTVDALIATIWAIANEFQKYPNVDSYDTTNATQYLYDMKLFFTTNKHFIRDYGRLIYKKNKQEKMRDGEDEAPNRNQNQDMITTTGIRIESHSTQEPFRGRRFGKQRPSGLIADDFEVDKTKESPALTLQIKKHFEEAMYGLTAEAPIIFLCNKITEYGNVAHFEDLLKNNPDAIVLDIPLYDTNNEVLWKSKYVHTDEEAKAHNRDESMQGCPMKVSIAAIKRKSDSARFSAEMLNQPYDDDTALFKRAYFKYISQDEVYEKEYNQVSITIDTAVSQTSRSDDTGISILYRDVDGMTWYTKSYKVHMRDTDLKNHLLSIYNEIKANNPITTVTVAWEKTQYTDGLKKSFDDLPFVIHEISHRGIKKEQRIQGALLWRYEQGLVWHIMSEGIGNSCSDLESQLVRFPFSKKDDIMDALAMQADDLFNVYDTNQKVSIIKTSQRR